MTNKELMAEKFDQLLWKLCRSDLIKIFKLLPVFNLSINNVCF